MKIRLPLFLGFLFIGWLAVCVAGPPVPAQRPPALSIRVNAGEVQLTATGAEHTTCQIQWTDMLSLTSRWFHLSHCLLSTAPSLLDDPISASVGARYYRAVCTPNTNMVWISPRTFTRGSPLDEPQRDPGEGPQTEVTISRGFWMGRHEVTQEEYSEVVGANPSYFRNGTPPYWGGMAGPVTNELLHPVEALTWFEATNYCGLLTERERLAGRLPEGYVYRLPSEAEWEYACRAGTRTPFHYGTELRSGMANFNGQFEYDVSTGTVYYPEGINLGRTVEVEGDQPNVWGLFDMHGNVREWCLDQPVDYRGGSLTDPIGLNAWSSSRVYRGGCFGCQAYHCRSAMRLYNYADSHSGNLGFRAVLARPLPPPNPDPVRLVWIPPGTFSMGSPETEEARWDDETAHVVSISHSFWMGKYEVTQGDYLEVVGSNPSSFRNGTIPAPLGTGGPVTNELLHPVETVTWRAASDFCALLTERERLAGRLPEGYVYRLPTEAEWEYACRAGTTTAFHCGDELRSGMANFDGQREYPPCGDSTLYCYNPGGIYLGRTTQVGSYAPNTWGLYDMHGNVQEWCRDHYLDYPGRTPKDWSGVTRGGSWHGAAYDCRSARRQATYPRSWNYRFGFRVVLARPAPADP